jgi:hypothetical protein
MISTAERIRKGVATRELTQVAFPMQPFNNASRPLVYGMST